MKREKQQFTFNNWMCLPCLIVLFFSSTMLGQEKGDTKKQDDEKEKVVAEKVTGTLVLINEKKLVANFAKAEFILEEQFTPTRPPLPKNWEDLKPEEQQAWGEKFLASDVGKAYQKNEEERFKKLNQFEIIVDDKGNFELEDVPFGTYFLQGRIGAIFEKRKYEAEVYASIKVEQNVDHVDLGELEIEMLPRIDNGDEAPDFTLDALEGDKKVTLSKFRGKFVLIDFWATWCGPCIQATPKVQEIYKKYQGKLEVIGVSMDEDKPTALEYSTKKEIKWVQAFAGPGKNPAVSNYGVQGIPSFWLIDPKGKVIANDKTFYEANFDFDAVLKTHIK